jgi:hypothetical protein
MRCPSRIRPASVRHTVDEMARTHARGSAAGREQPRAVQLESSRADHAPATRLEIQVMEPAAVHVRLVAQLTRWLDGSAINPADVEKKKLAS